MIEYYFRLSAKKIHQYNKRFCRSFKKKIFFTKPDSPLPFQFVQLQVPKNSSFQHQQSGRCNNGDKIQNVFSGSKTIATGKNNSTDSNKLNKHILMIQEASMKRKIIFFFNYKIRQQNDTTYYTILFTSLDLLDAFEKNDRRLVLDLLCVTNIDFEEPIDKHGNTFLHRAVFVNW